MTLKISPLRPNMMFTDNQGSLTKEAYDFLQALFLRVGGSLDSLNAATLEAKTWEAPGTIGTTTPNSGVFTTLSANNSVSYTGTNQTLNFSPTGTGKIFINSPTLGFMDNMYIGLNTPAAGIFTTIKSTGAFACNGKTQQSSYGLGPASTDLSSVITLANNIRIALINNGIGV